MRGDPDQLHLGACSDTGARVSAVAIYRVRTLTGPRLAWQS